MTEEQAALIEKARSSLDGARALLRIRLYGFAASRAYYTMFYAARALLLDKGLRFHKHSAVISALGERFAKTGLIPPEYHRYLIAAQDARITGDYEFQEQVPATEAELHIAHAEQFLDEAQKMLGSTGKTQ